MNFKINIAYIVYFSNIICSFTCYSINHSPAYVTATKFGYTDCGPPLYGCIIIVAYTLLFLLLEAYYGIYSIVIVERTKQLLLYSLLSKVDCSYILSASSLGERLYQLNICVQSFKIEPNDSM